jgi:hypothetical protein
MFRIYRIEDDCGFWETAFAKIKARVDGTRLAEQKLFS